MSKEIRVATVWYRWQLLNRLILLWYVYLPNPQYGNGLGLVLSGIGLMAFDG